MAGNVPKEGISFEVLIAAILHSEPIVSSYGSALDLTKFAFDLKPRIYDSEKTGVGYPVSVDITASGKGVEYHIECKESIDHDKILKVDSGEFVKSMLEFLALEYYAEKNGQIFNYLLAINFPAGQEIHSLIRNCPARLISKLRVAIIQRGKQLPNAKFKANVASKSRILRVLHKTGIIEMPFALINEKIKNNPAIEKFIAAAVRGIAPEDYSHSGAGPVILSTEKRILFNCKSITHLPCAEKTIRSTVCHIGHYENLIRKIVKRTSSIEKAKLVIIKTKDLGYRTRDVKVIGIDRDSVPGIVSDHLNELLRSRTSARVVLVKNTFDLVAFHGNAIAQLVKNSMNEDGEYDLERIREFDPLGSVKIAVAQYALWDSYGIKTKRTNFRTFEKG